jgi:hypothetical protein
MEIGPPVTSLTDLPRLICYTVQIKYLQRQNLLSILPFLCFHVLHFPLFSYLLSM